MQPTNQEEEGTSNAQIVVGTIGFVFVVVLLSTILGNAASGGEVSQGERASFTEPIEEFNNPVGQDSSPVELSPADFLECPNPVELTYSGQRPPELVTDVEEHFSLTQRDDLILVEMTTIGTDEAVGIFADSSGFPREVHFAGRFNNGWWTSTFLTCEPDGFAGSPVAAPSTSTPPRDVGEGDAEDSTTAQPTTSAPTTTASTTTTTKIPNGRPVPDVVGLEINDAILEIFDWDLQIVRENEASDEIEAGVVIRTDPTPGTQVAPGSPITLVVSTGSE